MDLPVEATVDLKRFRDPREALRLLRSHDFEVTNPTRGLFRVRGSYQKLKAVKLRLERLIDESAPPAGAVSQSSTHDDAAGGARSREQRSSQGASGSSRRSPASPPDRRQFGRESIMVDSDVYSYAAVFMKDELHALAAVTTDGESTTVTFGGQSSVTDIGELQELLSDLSRSLRTQEVLLSDLSADGKDLLKRIQKNGEVSGSVLVRRQAERLRLIGPSRESFELKQSLLCSPSGRRGRPAGGGPRARSGSAPASGRSGPAADGAAGFTPAPDTGSQRHRRLSQMFKFGREKSEGAKENQAEPQKRSKKWPQIKNPITSLFKKKK